MRERVLRVLDDRALEELRGALQTLVRALLEVIEALLAEVARRQVLGLRPVRGSR